MAERIRIPGGTLDPHVHLRTPGATHKESFITGTRAALKGGYTSVFDMPNNPTPITSVEALYEKKLTARGSIYVDVGFNYGGTVKSSGTFEKVYEHVPALKVYMNPTTGITEVPNNKELEVIFSSWPKGKPIIVHAEGPTFERALNMAKKTGRRLHLAHMSLKSEIELVKKAKNEGYPVTCEVSAHHLLLTEEDAESLPIGQGRMKPPLASSRDRDALWENLDVIDVLASDHAPHTKEEKEAFEEGKGPYGVTGLETTLPLMLTAVNDGRLSIEKLIDMISTKPREIFGLQPDPRTAVELVLGDDSYVINANNLETKAKQTPFDGWKVTGRVANVELRGVQILKKGKIVGLPQGKIL